MNKYTFTADEQSKSFQLDRESSEVGALQFISGTGTVVVEGSLDGVTYASIGLRKSTDDTIVASASAVGLWWFDCAAYDHVRARVDAFTADIVIGISFNRG